MHNRCAKRRSCLVVNIRWADLPTRYGYHQTVHWRFQEWEQQGSVRGLPRALADDLRDRGKLDVSECSVDATFASAKKGAMELATPARARGQEGKIMAMIDRHGLPVAVCTESVGRAEVSLVQLLFDFMYIEMLPEPLIGDRTYDSDKLDEELGQRGVEMIAPNRCNRWQSQDRRPLRHYKRRGRSSGSSAGCTTTGDW